VNTQPKAIAFDLDGTLIDSAPDIAAALNDALQRNGLPLVHADSVRGWIGDGPGSLIQRALVQLGVVRPDAPLEGDALQERLRHDFHTATLDAPLRHGRIYDGVTEMLDACAQPLAVVTNKPSALAHRVLQAAGLRSRFACVLGADAPALRKPAPALLLDAAMQLGVGPASLLMVGDSANDLHCARAAGCRAAWVSWGYGAWPCDAAPGTMRIDAPGHLQLALS
jgi:phosphoglycolate phosphatase